MVTSADASTHIIDVYEDFKEDRNMTVLRDDEFCYLMNPKDEKGQNQLGKKILVTGPRCFFVQPGEYIYAGLQRAFVLGEDEALLMRAEETHTEEDGTVRNAVDRWMVHGPCRYIPPVEVEIIEKRKSIPLDTNEGIYVRDNRDGSIRSVCGKTYMLKA